MRARRSRGALNWRRLLVGAGVLLAGAAVWLGSREALADALAQGLRDPLLGTRIQTFGAEPIQLVDRGSGMAAALFATGTLLLALYRGRPRDLLLARGEAFDLAVVRVVVFGVLAVLPRVREAVAVAGLPADLRRPPAGASWLLEVIPPSPTLLRLTAIAFVLACLCACAGLYTRTAATVAVVLGLYVLGVPQFYGKVSHYHHLLWIAAVLAAAPAGHAFSVDALRRGWRAGDPSAVKPAPAVAYGLPLRIIWLLIAAVYLFPGLWKFASAGWAWAFSDNLRTVMYEHWTRLDGFTPILPVDQWPAAYQLGGLFTLVFELTFLFWLWAPRARIVAVVTGLVFHNINYLFLRLSFGTLQLCYVAFVPWQQLARWIGSRGQTVDIAVDRSRAGRAIAALAAVDPFERARVTVVQRGVTVRGPGGTATRWDAVARALAALPVAWPLRPLAALVPAGRRGRWLEPATSTSDTAIPAPRRTVRTVSVVGTVLLMGVTFTGVAGATAAWPFACYPTFAGQARLSPEILLVLTAGDGRRVELPAQRLRGVVSWEKLDGMARPILQGRDDARQRAQALVTAAVEAGIDLPDAARVDVYRSQPAWSEGEVVSAGRRLLFTFRWTAPAQRP